MKKEISRTSVQRGNASPLISARHAVRTDGNSVTVRRNTVVGDCRMTFSRDAIVREAEKAFSNKSNRQ